MNQISIFARLEWKGLFGRKFHIRTPTQDQIRADFRDKIRGMSMEELLQMKQDIGTKAMDKMMGLNKNKKAGGSR